MNFKLLFLSLFIVYGCASNNTTSSITYYHWTKQSFNINSCKSDYENCNAKANSWAQDTNVTNTSILRSCMQELGYSTIQKARRSTKSETACGHYWK
jgi:hypothetical protein